MSDQERVADKVREMATDSEPDSKLLIRAAREEVRELPASVIQDVVQYHARGECGCVYCQEWEERGNA